MSRRVRGAKTLNLRTLGLKGKFPVIRLSFLRRFYGTSLRSVILNEGRTALEKRSYDRFPEASLRHLAKANRASQHTDRDKTARALQQFSPYAFETYRNLGRYGSREDARLTSDDWWTLPLPKMQFRALQCRTAPENKFP